MAVVGGGDSAIAKSLYLVPLAKQIFMYVRGKKFSAKDMGRVQELLRTFPKVRIFFETEIVGLQTEGKKLTSILIRNKATKKQARHNVDALFLAIGIIPNTSLFPTLTKREDGTIQTFEHQQTSQLGVFAAGDVTDSVFRQAITGAGEGCKSALQVKSYLDQHKIPSLSQQSPSRIQVKNGKVQLYPMQPKSTSASSHPSCTCTSPTCTLHAENENQSCTSPTPFLHAENQNILEIFHLSEWEKAWYEHILRLS